MGPVQNDNINLTQSQVTLSLSAKGRYSWDIKCSAPLIDGEELLQAIFDIDTRLKELFPNNSTTLVSKSTYKSIDSLDEEE